MAYTPATGGSTQSTGSLSGGSGSASFPVPTSLGSGTALTPAEWRDRHHDFGAGINPDPVVPPTFQSSDDLVKKLYALPQADLANLQTQLKLAGYGNISSTGFVDQGTLTAYRGLLTDTAAYAATGGSGYTPDTLLASKIAAGNNAQLNAGTGPQTNTRSSVSLTDPVTAQQNAITAWESHLGRKPTAKELAAVTAALTAYERSNPNRTNETVTPSASGQSVSSVSSAGANAATFTDTYALADQGRANEAGALNETRFVDVLHGLMSGR